MSQSNTSQLIHYNTPFIAPHNSDHWWLLGGIVVFLLLLISSWFFTRRKTPHKVLLTVAMGTDNYMRVTGKLQSDGVPYYVKFIGLGDIPGGEDTRLSEYEIYVKAEDEHKSQMSMNTL